jgi:hypothetical protein
MKPINLAYTRKYKRLVAHEVMDALIMQIFSGRLIMRFQLRSTGSESCYLHLYEYTSSLFAL